MNNQPIYLQLNPVHNGFLKSSLAFIDEPYYDSLYDEIRWYRKLVPIILYTKFITKDKTHVKEGYMGLLK